MKATGMLLKRLHFVFILSAALASLGSTPSTAQDQSSYMRIARIAVDSTRLGEYLAALKEQMQSALQLENGVLAYSALQDRKDPAQITILETYASVAAYQAHIQTEHFKRYKTKVADMVTHLELADVIPIAIQSKIK